MTLSRDDVLGLGVMVLAAAYWAAADQIPVSLLSDAVGADGAPKMYAVALGIVAALLLLSSRWRRVAEEPIDDKTSTSDGLRPHRRAALLLLGLIVYVVLLPVLGYPLAIALLLGGVAIYGGTRATPKVALVAIAGAAVFWVFFVKLLAVDMPTGIWLQGV